MTDIKVWGISMEINGKTRTYGIIGNPVQHTQSPVIHNTLSRDMGINMVYVPFHVEQGQLEAAVKGAYGLNILGMNVTVPYKNEVIPFLTDIDSLAGKIGSVNTLVRTNGGYKGYNTDITGLMRAMKSDGILIKDEEVIILGAGGVGRTAAFMCAAYGASKVYLLNRSVDKAECVAAEVNEALSLGNAKSDSEVSLGCVIAKGLDDYKELTKDGVRRYLVLQCTNIGMSPDMDNVVITDEAFYRCVKLGYDLIYTPWETKFIKLVKANGGEAYNGLKMLLYQGIDAFELWNSCKVPEESICKVYEMLQEKVKC